MIRIYKETYNWKPVKGSLPTKTTLCPRCNNQTEYFLAWDANEFGFPGIFTVATSKLYAYKCPICPAYEKLSVEIAKAIIKKA